MKTLRGYAFVVVTVLLIAVIVLCTGISAFSASTVQERELDLFYQEKEVALREEVRSFLNESGYVNAGVMINHVEIEEERIYTISVHHLRINALGEQQRGLLINSLCDLGFVDENCSFRVEIME